MEKKIIDIFPPKEKIQYKQKQEKKIKKKFFFSFLKTASVFFIFFSIFFILTNLGKLEIKIYPKIDSFTFQENIEVSPTIKKIDFKNKILPGRFFEKEVKLWKKFQSTGISEKGGKAKGKILVYNTHLPPRAITLIANTRFLSSQGKKIFRTSKKIYLPPAKVKNGKVIPGIIEINVIAQEPGDEYNIGPSKFSVPGLAGTTLYYSIYGESKSSMSGGFKKEVKIITKKDIENAKIVLKKILFEQAKKTLQKQTPPSFVLLEKAIIEIEEQIDCFQKPGQEFKDFSCEGRMKIKGLGFKVSDLKKLVNNIIISLIGSSKKIIKESLIFNYEKAIFIEEKKKLAVEFKIKGKSYFDIPIEKITHQLTRKSKEEIEKTIFDNYHQIRDVKIKFWPFWLKRAPKNHQRIQVKLIIKEG